LHLRDLLIDVLHELDDEVDELVLEHGFGVEIGDQEGYIIALLACSAMTSHRERGEGGRGEADSHFEVVLRDYGTWNSRAVISV
jgi:hypothetical protein